MSISLHAYLANVGEFLVMRCLSKNKGRVVGKYVYFVVNQSTVHMDEFLWILAFDLP